MLISCVPTDSYIKQSKLLVKLLRLYHELKCGEALRVKANGIFICLHYNRAPAAQRSQA